MPDAEPGDGLLDVVLVTEAERKRLQVEWTGFELHIDDKLRPKKNASPKEIAGIVEARMGQAAVELLVPAPKSNA